MELLVGDFVRVDLGRGFLDAASVERAMEEVEGDELERDAYMAYVHLEWNLRHLGLRLVRSSARQHLVLFLHGFVRLLLSFLVLSFSPYADCL